MPNTKILSESEEKQRQSDTTRRRYRDKSMDALKIRVTLDYVMQEYDLSLDELAVALASPSGAKNTLIWKWYSGKNLPTKRSYEKLQKAFPKSKNIYEHKLFSLFHSNPISMEEYESSVLPLKYTSAPSSRWKFPEDDPIFRVSDLDYPYDNGDDIALLYRLDVYGFIGLFNYVRECEIKGWTSDHCSAACACYYIFPYVFSNKLLYPYWGEFLSILRSMISRVISTAYLVQPNLEVMTSEIDRTHKTQEPPKPNYHSRKLIITSQT